jgi:hypothetical protein
MDLRSCKHEGGYNWPLITDLSVPGAQRHYAGNAEKCYSKKIITWDPAKMREVTIDLTVAGAQDT